MSRNLSKTSPRFVASSKAGSRIKEVMRPERGEVMVERKAKCPKRTGMICAFVSKVRFLSPIGTLLANAQARIRLRRLVLVFDRLAQRSPARCCRPPCCSSP